jgi:hypothetical protein
MELNCLYVNCNVLCIFWQIMNTYLLNLMHKIFKTCMFCVCTAFVLFFPSWLASLVELERARGKLEPSPIFRLVCKTSQPEPSHLQRAKCWLAPSPTRAGSCPALALSSSSFVKDHIIFLQFQRAQIKAHMPTRIRALVCFSTPFSQLPNKFITLVGGGISKVK